MKPYINSITHKDGNKLGYRKYLKALASHIKSQRK